MQTLKNKRNMFEVGDWIKLKALNTCVSLCTERLIQSKYHEWYGLPASSSLSNIFWFLVVFVRVLQSTDQIDGTAAWCKPTGSPKILCQGLAYFW